MDERSFDDITPEGIINGLQARDSDSRPKPEPVNIEIVRERFFKALKEIAHLEKALEEKNTALAAAAEEKDRLIHALNKAFEDKKRLQDRIADLDIVRNMEIVEFKTGLDKLTEERDFLHKEKGEIIEDIYKKDRAIEDLKYTIERKELHLKETQAYLDTALEALRNSDLKCKELEANYKAKEQTKTGLAEESPLIFNNMPQHIETNINTDTEPEAKIEYLNKIETLNNALTVLKTEIDEKTSENISLKNDISLIQRDRGRVTDEASAPEDLTSKLELAAGRNTVINEREKTVKELSADKKLLYVKAPENTESVSQFPEKMIYTAPPADIKNKALKIAILFILGMAGILLAYKFY